MPLGLVILLPGFWLPIFILFNG